MLHRSRYAELKVRVNKFGDFTSNFYGAFSSNKIGDEKGVLISPALSVLKNLEDLDMRSDQFIGIVRSFMEHP